MLTNRFWSKVDRSGDCWLWMGTRGPSGYGYYSGRRAHRLSYEDMVGPIPDGLVMDHLCRNPPCVNPAHLEPVTTLENTRRGIWHTKTHCVRGHEFTPENTRLDNGVHRVCRACDRIRSRGHYYRLGDSGRLVGAK